MDVYEVSNMYTLSAHSLYKKNAERWWNLYDSESVKEAIAKAEMVSRSKRKCSSHLFKLSQDGGREMGNTKV